MASRSVSCVKFPWRWVGFFFRCRQTPGNCLGAASRPSSASFQGPSLGWTMSSRSPPLFSSFKSVSPALCAWLDVSCLSCSRIHILSFPLAAPLFVHCLELWYSAHLLVGVSQRIVVEFGEWEHRQAGSSPNAPGVSVWEDGTVVPKRR